jgi:hypothetical protein
MTSQALGSNNCAVFTLHTFSARLHHLYLGDGNTRLSAKDEFNLNGMTKRQFGEAGWYHSIYQSIHNQKVALNDGYVVTLKVLGK